MWSVGVECVCEQGVIQDFEVEGGNVAKKGQLFQYSVIVKLPAMDTQSYN